MAVDPDITAEFIRDKILEIDPLVIIAHLHGALHGEVLAAIANAEQLDVINADGEVGTGPVPATNITPGRIVLKDSAGNMRVLTATGDTVTPNGLPVGDSD